MRDDHRSPDNASGPGLQLILVPGSHIKGKGIILLSRMPGTVASVDETEAMQARCHLEVLKARTGIHALGINAHQPYRLRQHEARIRLRAAWLLRQGETAQQPKQTT
jgi:hypothetical protein